MSQAMENGLGGHALVDALGLDLQNAVVIVLDHIHGELRQHLKKKAKIDTTMNMKKRFRKS